MEIRCSFCLGFVKRSHKPLNCWGYESKISIGVKKNMESSKLCGFIKNWWTLGGVLGFSPRVLMV